MRVIIFELLCIFRLFSFRSILFGNVSDLSFANGMTFCSKLQCPVVAILFVVSKDKEELSFKLSIQTQVVEILLPCQNAIWTIAAVGYAVGGDYFLNPVASYLL